MTVLKTWPYMRIALGQQSAMTSHVHLNAAGRSRACVLFLSLDYHWIIIGLPLDYHWITIGLPLHHSLDIYCPVDWAHRTLFVSIGDGFRMLYWHADVGRHVEFV